MSKLTRVKFTRSMSPYITGDEASFPRSRAEDFVDRGYATYVDRQMRKSKPTLGERDTEATTEDESKGKRSPRRQRLPKQNDE